MFCSKCPPGKYSDGGNFLIRGNNSEWTKNVISKFRNNCFLKNENNIIIENISCSPWTISKNGIGLESGFARQYNSIYYAELIIFIKLINPGRVKINCFNVLQDKL